MLAHFAGETLEQFGELVRDIATGTFDLDGSAHLLVACRPHSPVAIVMPIPAQYFQSPETENALGQEVTTLGARGVVMIAIVTEGWYVRPGSAAFEERERSERSLQEMRKSGIEGVGEKVTAWIADAETQAVWTAEIERDASGARLGRWEQLVHAASRWHPWFKVGIVEYGNREGAGE
jgi:hypothetical protein